MATKHPARRVTIAFMPSGVGGPQERHKTDRVHQSCAVGLFGSASGSGHPGFARETIAIALTDELPTTPVARSRALREVIAPSSSVSKDGPPSSFAITVTPVPAVKKT
jgi:hypothetical protein